MLNQQNFIPSNHNLDIKAFKEQQNPLTLSKDQKLHDSSLIQPHQEKQTHKKQQIQLQKQQSQPKQTKTNLDNLDQKKQLKMSQVSDKLDTKQINEKNDKKEQNIQLKQNNLVNNQEMQNSEKTNNVIKNELINQEYNQIKNLDNIQRQQHVYNDSLQKFAREQKEISKKQIQNQKQINEKQKQIKIDANQDMINQIQQNVFQSIKYSNQDNIKQQTKQKSIINHIKLQQQQNVKVISPNAEKTTHNILENKQSSMNQNKMNLNDNLKNKKIKERNKKNLKLISRAINFNLLEHKQSQNGMEDTNSKQIQLKQSKQQQSIPNQNYFDSPIVNQIRQNKQKQQIHQQSYQQLKKQIIDLKQTINSLKREKIHPKIQNHQQLQLKNIKPNESTHKINQQLQLSRTSSIIQYYERYKNIQNYPQTPIANPQNMFQRSLELYQKNYNNGMSKSNNINKIILKKIEQGKQVKQQQISPSFRIRNLNYNISSQFQNNSRFINSESKNKTRSKDLIGKIYLNSARSNNNNNNVSKQFLSQNKQINKLNLSYEQTRYFTNEFTNHYSNIKHKHSFQRLSQINNKYKFQQSSLVQSNLQNFQQSDLIIDYSQTEIQFNQQFINQYSQLQKLLIVPNFQSKPIPKMTADQFINLGKNTFELFNISLDSNVPLEIKKYKNCVYFKATDKHILWHFSGKFYFGGWSNEQNQGQKSGEGLQYFPYKYIYKGQFNRGKRNGNGIMKNHQGDIYHGEWLNGLKHGIGKQYQKSGLIYEGDWYEGKKQGFGRIFISKEQQYQGQFYDDKKNGYGKQKFANGDSYEGDYINNKFSGNGTYVKSDKSIYQGQFLNGLKHGKGVWKQNSDNKGDFYQGSYRNDKKQGKGKYIWKDNTQYIGMFSKDKKHGQGILKLKQQKEIKGIWQNDMIKSILISDKSKESLLLEKSTIREQDENIIKKKANSSFKLNLSHLEEPRSLLNNKNQQTILKKTQI